MSSFVSTDATRLAFSEAMSLMYREEVPLYGDLLDIVATTNARALEADPALRAQLAANGELERLNAERHGAIRVGTAEELSLMRRLFAVMGKAPVGYYDLGVAGLPTRATEILAERRIVSDKAINFIEKFENDGGLSSDDMTAFVAAALETFRWHGEALVDSETYAAFNAAHRLVADIVCFRGPHINHLTPRTLDIDAAQAEMIARGIKAKTVIEGPPRRDAPILLRQTSFQALEEAIHFRDGDRVVAGAHTARFGEIEQRGIALTPRGRALYDEILAEAEAARTTGGANYQAQLAAAFPDDVEAMRDEGLAYFSYTPTPEASRLIAAGKLPAGSVDELVDAGLLIATPITYEDFLPVSAAGIFRSNLSDDDQGGLGGESSQAEFEAALGMPCLDPFGLYLDQERDSIDALERATV
jgi:uncharacterized glyoxalase superfamily metalloenzyme YdcJ